MEKKERWRELWNLNRHKRDNSGKTKQNILTSFGRRNNGTTPNFKTNSNCEIHQVAPLQLVFFVYYWDVSFYTNNILGALKSRWTEDLKRKATSYSSCILYKDGSIGCENKNNTKWIIRSSLFARLGHGENPIIAFWVQRRGSPVNHKRLTDNHPHFYAWIRGTDVTSRCFQYRGKLPWHDVKLKKVTLL